MIIRIIGGQMSMTKNQIVKICLTGLICVATTLTSSCSFRATSNNTDKNTMGISMIHDVNTILPLPSTHELSFTHDDKHLYLFSQEGFFITLDPVSEKVNLIDRSNDDILVNEVNRLQGTPFIFNDILVVDRYADRISITTTFFKIPSFDVVNSTNIIFYNTPMLITENYLYRIGNSVHTPDYRITTQDASGKVLWMYPKYPEGGVIGENYDAPFFFQNLHENNGVLHLIQANYSQESLYHVAIESSTGHILLEEKIGEYTSDAWWETMFINYPGKRVIWMDETVIIQAQDRHGVYLARFSMNDDLSLKEQWKQYYSDTPYHEERFPTLGLMSGISQLNDHEGFILLPVWKEKNDMGYVFDLYCIEPNSGHTLWKFEEQKVSYRFELYGSQDYLVMKTDKPEKYWLKTIELSTGNVAQKTQLSPPNYNKELGRSSTIDTFIHGHYYSFDEQSLILTKVNPLDGSHIQSKLDIQDKVEKAYFQELRGELFLICKTSRSSLHNCIIFRVE